MARRPAYEQGAGSRSRVARQSREGIGKDGKVVDVIKALGGLPGSSVHCAVLAAQTVQEAIGDYLFSKEHKDRKTGR